ncbi:MAG: hypothetical protein ABH804_02010 [archaeon]
MANRYKKEIERYSKIARWARQEGEYETQKRAEEIVKEINNFLSTTTSTHREYKSKNNGKRLEGRR